MSAKANDIPKVKKTSHRLRLRLSLRPRLRLRLRSRLKSRLRLGGGNSAGLGHLGPLLFRMLVVNAFHVRQHDQHLGVHLPERREGEKRPRAGKAGRGWEKGSNHTKRSKYIKYIYTWQHKQQSPSPLPHGGNIISTQKSPASL